MRVADAKGAPPTIPFWLGEAPARSDELSRAVSDLRAEIEARLTADDEVRRKPDTTDDTEVRLTPDTTKNNGDIPVVSGFSRTVAAIPVVSRFPPPPEATARHAEARFARDGGSRTC